MKKILVADDDALNRQVLVKIIEREGYITIQSHNGEHAYETLLCNNDIGLIVTDIMMPKVNGRELVDKIRNRKEYKDLPIIMVSAALGIQDIFDILDSGVSWFYPKPIKRKEFLNLVDHIYQTYKY